MEYFLIALSIVWFIGWLFSCGKYGSDRRGYSFISEFTGYIVLLICWPIYLGFRM